MSASNALPKLSASGPWAKVSRSCCNFSGARDGSGCGGSLDAGRVVGAGAGGLAVSSHAQAAAPRVKTSIPPRPTTGLRRTSTTTNTHAARIEGRMGQDFAQQRGIRGDGPGPISDATSGGQQATDIPYHTDRKKGSAGGRLSPDDPAGGEQGRAEQSAEPHPADEPWTGLRRRFRCDRRAGRRCRRRQRDAFRQRLVRFGWLRPIAHALFDPL